MDNLVADWGRARPLSGSGGRVKPRINEHHFLFSADSSRGGSKWMDGLLPFHKPAILPLMWHFPVCASGHFPSGFFPSGRPDLPENHSTRGLGFTFYSLSSRLWYRQRQAAPIGAEASCWIPSDSQASMESTLRGSPKYFWQVMAQHKLQFPIQYTSNYTCIVMLIWIDLSLSTKHTHCPISSPLVCHNG